ncbi:hypothetical protein F5Y18DRAFT_421854 [Xylariaceae sp. FL1019]|nr:hypothetical protein F5Y18DRAFT_421854 [Xylariaceae sp. FL1019]
MAPRMGEGVDLGILTEEIPNTGAEMVSGLPNLPSSTKTNIVGRDYPIATNFPYATSLPKPPGQTSTSPTIVVITEFTTATLTTVTLVTSQSVVTSAAATAAPSHVTTGPWSTCKIVGTSLGGFFGLLLLILLTRILFMRRKRWRKLVMLIPEPLRLDHILLTWKEKREKRKGQNQETTPIARRGSPLTDAEVTRELDRRREAGELEARREAARLQKQRELDARDARHGSWVASVAKRLSHEAGRWWGAVEDPSF